MKGSSEGSSAVRRNMKKSQKTVRRKRSTRKTQKRKHAGAWFTGWTSDTPTPPPAAPASAPSPPPPKEEDLMMAKLERMTRDLQTITKYAEETHRIIHEKDAQIARLQPQPQPQPQQQQKPPSATKTLSKIPYCASLQRMKETLRSDPPVACAWGSDTLVSTALGPMLTNGGKDLTLTPDIKAKMVNAQGKFDCDRMVEQMQRLNARLAAYKSCDTLRKIRRIAMYRFDFEREQLMLVPVMFDMFPEVKEIHMGLHRGVTMNEAELRQVEADLGGKYALVTRADAQQGAYLVATRR